MPTLPACGRHDLGDHEWTVLEPCCRPGKKPGRPRKWSLRQLIDGIRWRTRTGSPWRDVPEQYGPWQSVYGLFRRWQLDGTWAVIVLALQALADDARHVTWDVSVDSGTARAHQHAAGARKNPAAQKEPPGPEPGDHGLGRSRGGLTTKFHLAVDQGQKPLAVIVTGGQGDSPQFIPVLEKIRVPRLHGGLHQTGTGSSGTRRTGRAPTGSTCAAPGSAAPSPRRRTSSRTGRRRAAQAAARTPSTRRGTSSGTPWSAGSTGSSATVPSPPATTSSPSATRPPSTSPPSESGSGLSLLRHGLVPIGCAASSEV